MISPVVSKRRIYRRFLKAICTLSVGGSALTLHADVRLPALFTDHMVLQQGKPIPVWGWAAEGEGVTVEFRGQTVKTVAREGRWTVKLRAVKYLGGGAEVLTVAGHNRIQIRDVLVGEVWVASGQSNMQLAMSQSYESAPDIESSANPQLRLFYVPRVKSQTPAQDVEARWEESGSKSVRGFSAVAYYFGRELQAALGVPVGLIHTSWGGSPAEVWVRREVLAADPDYRRDILEAGEQTWARYEAALAKFGREQAALKAEGKAPAGRAPGAPWRPSELYNGMIAPLLPYAVQGAIWYQGESNAGRAHQYRTLIQDMIRNWRQDWRQGDFTFLQVQLAPWDRNKKRSLAEITAVPVESDWAELREAQSLAVRQMRRVGMAVITDVGDKDDIHPTKKQPVGARLALEARRLAYGQRIESSGPVYRNHATRGGEMLIRFDHVGEGLEARGGALTGFAICGEDRKFVWGNARIEGSAVLVGHPSISKPVAVRYGWADYPVVNLWNKEGLPASPFRTDDFPMITAPKK